MSSRAAVWSEDCCAAREAIRFCSHTQDVIRKDCLVWTDDHQHDDDHDGDDDVDDDGTQGKKRSALVKELVIMPVKYTRSYYTCSGCDTAYKKYGNLMKHIERPIFPRHIQSALTLIVVQKTENHRLYFTVFRSVESNMEIWKLQCASTLGCCEQNTAPQKPTLPTFLKHQKFAIQ